MLGSFGILDSLLILDFLRIFWYKKIKEVNGTYLNRKKNLILGLYFLKIEFIIQLSNTYCSIE